MSARQQPSTPACLKAYVTVLATGTTNTWSSFAALVGDARQVTGRDRNSGVPQLFAADRHAMGALFTGALRYLVLLDQIGQTLTTPRPRDTSADGTEELYYAIRDFAPLQIATDHRQQSALYGVRCALAHEYSAAYKASPVAVTSSNRFDPADPILLRLPRPGQDRDGEDGTTADPTFVNGQAGPAVEPRLHQGSTGVMCRHANCADRTVERARRSQPSESKTEIALPRRYAETP